MLENEVMHHHQSKVSLIEKEVINGPTTHPYFLKCNQILKYFDCNLTHAKADTRKKERNYILNCCIRKSIFELEFSLKQ